MSLAEQRAAIARAIWNIRREEDRCDIELEDLGANHSVWREADAAIAALPKPEPVGMFWHNGKGRWEQDTPERRIKGITHPLYTTPPQPDDVRDALRRVASVAHMGGLAQMTESDALTAIRRATIPYFDADATEEQHLAALAAAKGEVR